MTSRICICCGKPFRYDVNEANDNPNICTACSQMAEGTTVDVQAEPPRPASTTLFFVTFSVKLTTPARSFEKA